MHRSLNIDDILTLLACELVESGLKATAVSFACCCRSFEDLVMHVLWRTQDELTPLLKCLPQEVWTEERGTFHFQRIPTRAEWTGFQKYARRIRKLKFDAYDQPVAPETLLALQHRATIADESLLPRLKSFKCQYTTEAFVPFIPLILSPQTTEIEIFFTKNSPTVAIASTISVLPSLCPNLERIVFDDPDRNPVIIDAVSEMLLACNRDTLRDFLVYSPTTGEEQEVLHRFPKLSQLLVVIEGHTPLLTMVLPNLTSLAVEYDDHLDWLQGFTGATLDRLEAVTFRSESIQVGDFLGAFGSVALTTSITNTLLRFRFLTSSSWNPDFSPLLPFKQLKKLEIEFYCNDCCPSRVDDDAIITLAQAMPRLEILRLGSTPCDTPAGATVHGLVALASHCLHLSKLRILFQGNSLVGATAGVATTPPPIGEPVTPREHCALTDLEVGSIPIPAQSATKVMLMLLQIFPCLLNVEHTNPEWTPVAETIRDLRRTGFFVLEQGVDGGRLSRSPQDLRSPLPYHAPHLAETDNSQVLTGETAPEASLVMFSSISFHVLN